ncbi:hypothetical protein ACQKWADRAFT_297370 [Trichoderma austrokoningii]
MLDNSLSSSAVPVAVLLRLLLLIKRLELSPVGDLLQQQLICMRELALRISELPCNYCRNRYVLYLSRSHETTSWYLLYCQ